MQTEAITLTRAGGPARLVKLPPKSPFPPACQLRLVQIGQLELKKALVSSINCKNKRGSHDFNNHPLVMT